MPDLLTAARNAAALLTVAAVSAAAVLAPAPAPTQPVSPRPYVGLGL